MVVTLVAILVLLTAILQIGQLGILHSRTLHDARDHAGALSLLPNPTFAGPDYIADWTPGADGATFSRDDQSRSGWAGGFESGIVQPAHPQILAGYLPANPVSPLAGNALPQMNFGLIQAHANATNSTLPIVRRLVYAADSIEVEGRAWATWTKGIY